MKNKYITVRVSGIVTRVAEKTPNSAHVIGVIDAVIPSDIELDTWSEQKQNEWINQNNKRMRAICKLLNDKNL